MNQHASPKWSMAQTFAFQGLRALLVFFYFLFISEKLR